MDTPEEALSHLPVPGPGARYIVAFSGGLDSSVLLHALAAAVGGAPLEAVHVHHGLQDAADEWVAHCRAQCEALGVPLTVMEVNVGSGGEAAAREARYAALRDLSRPGDVVVTAQHADDQAETFLLQALRGAGTAGLAAMPETRPFGAATLARPFLRVRRERIEAWAREHGLDWIEDPSNRDPAVARSALRRRVMPALAAVRSGAVEGLLRTADAAAEAAALAAEVADEDWTACAGPVPGSLDLRRLAELSAARRRNLLRRWPARHGLPSPPPRQVDAIERDLMPARPDAAPLVAWDGAEIRRYRDWLFLMPPLPPPPGSGEIAWNPETPLALPPGCGWLTATQAAGAGLRREAGPFSVRFRRGGERLRLPGRAHDTDLKSWLQDAGAPPWVRDRLPLIHAGDRLAAAADYLVCEGFAAAANETGYCPRWVAPPTPSRHY